MPPRPSPHAETPVNRLLETACPCGHAVDRHDTGDTGYHGCRVRGCPCVRWYRLERRPALELVDGVVAAPTRKKEAS